MNEALVERAQGCLLGQLCGDALGSQVEFSSAASIKKSYPNGVRQMGASPVWNTLPGQVTDDSELALALARTLVEHGFDFEKIASVYGDWLLSGPFDVGGTIRQATQAIIDARSSGEELELTVWDRANWDSEANGAMMRQSPLAIRGYRLPPKELAFAVLRDTGLTHPNQVCKDASAALIVAMSRAIREGLDGKATYETALDWNATNGLSASVTQALEKAAKEKPNFEWHQGHVLIALQNAFYQALNAPTFEEGVVDTVMGGGDTDTNGAIAGALLGAIHGLGSIPQQWRVTVLNCRPEKGRKGVQHPRPQMYWSIDALDLARQLVEVGSRRPKTEDERDGPGGYSMLQRWWISDHAGWGPRPLSSEQKEMQDANRCPTDSVESVKRWLAKNGISEEAFRQQPLYDLLKKQHPHLKDL